MKKTLKHISRIVLLIAVFAILTAANSGISQYKELAIIGHLGEAPETISAKEFDKIIHGQQQRWKGGKNVSIGLLKTSHPVGKKTAELVFDMTGNELNKYWLGLVFEGKTKAPEFFNSEQELIDYVAITPGAVGVISASTQTDKVAIIKLK